MENAVLFELLAGVVYLVAGVRLAVLARRTRAIPEALLTAAFLCLGLSYMFYNIPLMQGSEPVWSTFTGRLLAALGIGFLPFFTLRVFRGKAAWAKLLAGANVLLLVVGISLAVLNGDFEGYTVSAPWFWLEWCGYMLPYVWIASEAFLAYSSARKRKRIGLTSAMVTNRYLLWGLYGVLGMAANCVTLAMYRAYEATQVWQAEWDVGFGGLEMLSIAMMWLVFFPPRFYRRWIGGQDADPAAAGGG